MLITYALPQYPNLNLTEQMTLWILIFQHHNQKMELMRMSSRTAMRNRKKQPNLYQGENEEAEARYPARSRKPPNRFTVQPENLAEN